MEHRFIVGVDEVGRGPVAGPVYVCAFLLETRNIEEIIKNTNLPIRDSKKLTEKMRNKWFEYLQRCLKEKSVNYVVTKVSNKEIDDKGIAVCIKAAIANSLEKLNISKAETKIMLDGGLFAPSTFQQETFIKGDEDIPVISMASIVAKVLRDREMVGLSKKYDKYLWEKNKGYGTKAHMDAIKKFGVSPLHRVSFLKKYTRE